MITQTIQESVKVLKKGGVILHPTDTIWGIGCDATNTDSINKIYKIKNRPKKKPLILLVNDIGMLSNYVDKLPEKAIKLIEESSTPTTIIYNNPKNLPEILIKKNTIAIRVTNDYFCNEIIKKLNKPIASTSANISTDKSPKNFKKINNQIKQMVDYIAEHKIDINLEKPSRIVKINSNEKIEVVR